MQPYVRLDSTARYHTNELTHEDITWLKETYDLHEIIEEDIREKITHDKIDVYDSYLFLVLHFPKYLLERGKYILNEFNIILGKDFIVTIADAESTNIERIKHQFEYDIKSHQEAGEEYKHSPYYVLYRIIDSMFDKTIRGTRSFARDLLRLEKVIFDDRELSPSTLENIMVKRRNLVLLKHTYLPGQEIIDELQKETLKFYGGELDVYFEDLSYKIEKILSSISVLSEDVDSLYDSHNALIGMKTNTIVTVLTIFTAIIGLLTLITGFYGMNIALPFSDAPYIYAGVGGIMLLLSGIMIARFRKKKWM